MANKSIEQFDVLSNTLRVLPEEAFRLSYFLKEINEPEEGISNIEIACVNVFNQIYGMMCSLKEDGHISSIYDSDAITTILCIRHVLQHQSGRIRNNLRDTLNKRIKKIPVLVQFNTAGDDFPFFINIDWIQTSIKTSNNAKKLPLINAYWNLDKIKMDVEKSSNLWESSYICVMPIITEAIRQIVMHYGGNFTPSGYDSQVYYDHFSNMPPVNADNYKIIT
jgi:hypothetical protein